jgi:hypothetical protein
MSDEVSNPTISRAIGLHRAGPAGDVADACTIVSWSYHLIEPRRLAVMVGLCRTILGTGIIRDVVVNQCLRIVEESVLPIRWGQGKCAAPLFDGVFHGVWDWVDAVLMYLHADGSPAEAKRFVRIIGPRDAPSKTLVHPTMSFVVPM